MIGYIQKNCKNLNEYLNLHVQYIFDSEKYFYTLTIILGKAGKPTLQ